MNANRKEIVLEATGAIENSTRPVRKLVPAAIHPGRRMLLVILALGLITGLGLMLEGRVTAQTFTNLHSFSGSDGANPYAGLTVTSESNTLYGTTANGGSPGWAWGTVFKVNADGTGFTNLHTFTGSDGANPWAGLILSGHTLYGTAYSGGNPGYGTVFAINTDGTGFTNLHSFTAPAYIFRLYATNSDGAFPNGGLILSSNTLYGTAAHGGRWGHGTVFAVNTDGTGFTTFHSFTAPVLQRFYYYAGYVEYYVEINLNPDGAVPVAGLMLSGSTLYGTASGGGHGGNGTVFAVNTDGTGFTTLHGFEQTENLTRHIVGGGGGGCTGGGCGAGSQCVGGHCGCMGFCIGGG